MYFSWATGVNPKSVNNQIKEAILSSGRGHEETPATQSSKKNLYQLMSS